MNKYLEQVLKNALAKCEGLEYGEFTITLKFHESRVTKICYSTTENTKEIVK